MYKFTLFLILSFSYASGNFGESISEGSSSSQPEVTTISESTTVTPLLTSTVSQHSSVDPTTPFNETRVSSNSNYTQESRDRHGQRSTSSPPVISIGNHAFQPLQEESSISVNEISPVAVSEPTAVTSTQEPVENATTPVSSTSRPAPSDPFMKRQDSKFEIGHIISHEVKSTTFVTSNQTAVPVKSVNWTKGSQYSHVVQLSPEFKVNENSLVRGSHMHPSETLPSEGFVQTVISAYKDHHNLVIRPDDIWTAILVQFSRYVNANAEELRHHFVSHTGQKTITLTLDRLRPERSGGRLTTSEWTKLLNQIHNEVMALSNRNLTWFVSNDFTTSKTPDRMVAVIVFLSAMQHYFRYDVAVYCGIPQITVQGQIADWVKIRERVEFIKTFGHIPTKWSELLLPIIDQFIQARNGTVDGAFWSDMVRVQTNEKCAGNQEESFLNGWITAFTVFDRIGTWRGERYLSNKWPKINMMHVPSGVVRVPVTIKSGKKNAMTEEQAILFAGHMGHHISFDKKTLYPYAGWAVAVKKATNTS